MVKKQLATVFVVAVADGDLRPTEVGKAGQELPLDLGKLAGLDFVVFGALIIAEFEEPLLADVELKASFNPEQSRRLVAGPLERTKTRSPI